MLVEYLITVWLIWWAGWLLVGLSANKNKQRESIIARLEHLTPMLVGIVMLFAPAFVTWQSPLGWDERDKWLISIFVLVGLGFTCWARYHLGRNWSGLVTTKIGHQLVTSGPYRLVRHPIYTGIVIAVFASALAVNSWFSLLGAVIWASTYIIKLNHEEKLLQRQFGVDWTQQRHLVHDKLIPGIF